MGLWASRSTAAEIRDRAGALIRRRYSTAFPLIRIDQVTPTVVPAEHPIAGVVKPFDGHRKVFKVLEVTRGLGPARLPPRLVRQSVLEDKRALGIRDYL